jgi:FG-GAP-like repeat
VDRSKLRGGDFNGDGKTDVFTTWGGKWRVSYGGTTAWKILNTSSVGVSDLRFDDFNGDGKTDILTIWGGQL